MVRRLGDHCKKYGHKKRNCWAPGGGAHKAKGAEEVNEQKDKKEEEKGDVDEVSLAAATPVPDECEDGSWIYMVEGCREK